MPELTKKAYAGAMVSGTYPLREVDLPVPGYGMVKMLPRASGATWCRGLPETTTDGKQSLAFMTQLVHGEALDEIVLKEVIRCEVVRNRELRHPSSMPDAMKEAIRSAAEAWMNDPANLHVILRNEENAVRQEMIDLVGHLDHFDDLAEQMTDMTRSFQERRAALSTPSSTPRM